ncbi:hypothetical protein GZ77_21450 [Endozoicomonas montiporae]|uniref:Uncharacterized protein n=2 Tax=Endozoicomonas montiporae TaxID=1027273 RepID=A0A081N3G7_9GAMM|nr:hypothetical protein [Endozoicomonas montiporae]AMO58297.1 hypothetical protein EZMO1_4381 [Endozoicomonas montiporae CL-33]KEQ12990.1 hypothetical protein GZ77_21450 [Endozoicomonas montiporae]
MNHGKNNDDPIDQIQISVRNSQNDIRKLFLHSAKQERAMEELQTVVTGIAEATAAVFKQNENLIDKLEQEQAATRKEIAALNTRFDRQDRRLEKIEEILIRIVNNLASK